MAYFFDSRGPLFEEGSCKDEIIHQGELFLNGERKSFQLTKEHLLMGNSRINLCFATITLLDTLTIRIYKNGQEILLKEGCQNIQFWFNMLRSKGVQNNITSFYDIEKCIGQGQFGSVYRVLSRDKQNYAAKAIKKINCEADHLMKEITIMRQLKHPRIVRLYEIFEEKDYVFLILELMQYSLSTIRITEEKKWAILILQICKTVKYLHNQKIIHRDLKPDNILFRDANNIAICDFGLADFYNEQSKYKFQRCGTPGYVAPEVLRDQFYDYKIDVYSIGIILYYMIVGQQPFHAQSQSEIVHNNYQGYIDFSTIQASPLCISFLKNVLSTNPHTRPSSTELVHHEWFVEQLGETHHLEMLNVNQSMTKLPQIKVTEMQEELNSDSEEDPPQDIMAKAIDQYQLMIQDIKKKNLINFVTSVLQQQHIQMKQQF